MLNVFKSISHIRELYSLVAVVRGIFNKKTPPTQADAKKLLSGLTALVGLVLAITVILGISYFCFHVYNDAQATWLHVREMLEGLKEGLNSPIKKPEGSTKTIPTVDWLAVMDNKICEIFNILTSAKTYSAIAINAISIFDKCLGIFVIMSNFITSHPATFLGVAFGFPFARALNVLWLRDITESMAQVIQSIWTLMATNVAQLTHAYTQTGLALRGFITNVIGGSINMVLLPVNITIQFLSIVLTGITTVLNAIAGYARRFYNAIARVVTDALNWLRDFFRPGEGGGPGDGPGDGPGGGPGPNGGDGGIGSLANAVDGVNETILSTNVHRIPGLTDNQIMRLFHSAPGDGSVIPGQIVLEPEVVDTVCTAFDAVDPVAGCLLKTMVIALAVAGPVAATVCCVPA